MDPSISKLLEEDENESMLSQEDVNAIYASLYQENEGGNHSSSQQFAILNNGIEDANTNNLHIHESTQMKEQQQSVLVNQDQELKPESGSPLQHNLPQDNRQPGQLNENPSHVPQASNLQSRNNSISTEQERPQPQRLKPQKMSSLRTHGVEQPVGSVNRVPREVQVCECIRMLIAQVDKYRGQALRTLFDKYKSKEFTEDRFFRQVRVIVGEEMTVSATRKLDAHLKQGKKGIKVPDGLNHNRESFTSAGSVTKDRTVSPSSPVVPVKQKWTDQSFDQVRKPCSLVQQDVTNVPLKQSNGNPRRSNDDFANQSSKMVLSASTTHANFTFPSMTTQLDSSYLVHFSAPAGTIPAGSNARTRPIIPFVGQKKPMEAQDSSLPPLSKRQKLWDTSLAQSDKISNDVTELSGINLMEEEINLLTSRPKTVSPAIEEEGRTIVQKVPLQRKLAEIMAKTGIKHIKDDVERCLSVCVEERMRELLSKIFWMSKQRTDPEKHRNRICITSDLRKQVNEINQKAKEEWERKHGGEEKLKNEENNTAEEDKRSEKGKANKKEQAEKIAKVTNAAALASLGGTDALSRWKLMAKARPKSSSVLGRNSNQLSGETGGSPKVVRSISVKDVIAVLEKEPQMSRSRLMYRLYNRI